MVLSFEIDQISFTVELKRDPQFRPHPYEQSWDKAALKDLKKGRASFYEIQITSCWKSHKLVHFRQGELFSTDEHLRRQELEDWMNEAHGPAAIIRQWRLIQQEDD